jgi:hypothetical protein
VLRSGGIHFGPYPSSVTPSLHESDFITYLKNVIIIFIYIKKLAALINCIRFAVFRASKIHFICYGCDTVYCGRYKWT